MHYLVVFDGEAVYDLVGPFDSVNDAASYRDSVLRRHIDGLVRISDGKVKTDIVRGYSPIPAIPGGLG